MLGNPIINKTYVFGSGLLGKWDVLLKKITDLGKNIPGFYRLSQQRAPNPATGKGFTNYLST